MARGNGKITALRAPISLQLQLRLAHPEVSEHRNHGLRASRVET